MIASRDITQPASLAPTRPAKAEDALCVDTLPTEAKAQPQALYDESAVSIYLDALKSTGAISLEAGVPVSDTEAMREMLKPYLGRPIDQALLGGMTRSVVSYLDTHSGGLNDVYFPAQKTADGYVVLVIAPARVGRVIAKGQRFTDAQALTCRIRQRHGERVDTRVVADDLAYLNRNPWRRTDVAFAPGQMPGETDLILNTNDVRPVRTYATVDNGGTRIIGLGRYGVGLNWGNPFGQFDHRLDLSYVQAQNSDVYQQGTLAYAMPLRNRDLLSSYVSVSRTHVSLEDGLFDFRGDNTLVGLEWSRLLGIDTQSWPGAYPEFYSGIEYKRIGSSLAFGEVPLSEAVPEILQFYAGYRSGWSDAWGHNDFDGRMTYSPGNLLGHNDDETFEQSRPGAPSEYARLNFSYDRYIALPRQWQFHTRLKGQYATQPLLSAEEFAVSGAAQVRGYYEDTLITDSGLVLNLELQTPYIPVPIGPYQGLLQGLIFSDFGRGWSEDRITNSDLDRTARVFNLASQGIGARFNLNPTLTLRADLGWRTSGLSARGEAIGSFSLMIAN
ncbi:ShlB/FhaC/HecB family hemolysin secretion/activation protein [Pseudomonas lini]